MRQGSVSCARRDLVDALKDRVQRPVDVREALAQVRLHVAHGDVKVVLLDVVDRDLAHVVVKPVDGIVDAGQDISSKNTGQAESDVEKHLVIHIITLPLRCLARHRNARRRLLKTHCGFVPSAVERPLFQPATELRAAQLCRRRGWAS